MDGIPYKERIVVKPIPKPERKTAGGMIIPAVADENSDQPKYGEIISVAKFNKDDKPMTLKVGYVVLYPYHAGLKFGYEGTDYLLLKEGEILHYWPPVAAVK